MLHGHTRKKAAEFLKIEEVPCIVADDLTPEKIQAFRLADNKTAEFAQWDMNKLNEELLQLTKFDIDMNSFGFEFDFDIETKVDEDEFDEETALEEIEEPTSKPGEIYKLGNHRLMCGDSTKKEDVQKLMDGKKADLLITDPPYNVDYNSKNKVLDKFDKGNRVKQDILNDNKTDGEFRNFLTMAFYNCFDSLKEGAAFYVWYAQTQHVNFETALKNNKFKIAQILIWVKNNHVLGLSDYHWKHEPCFYGWKEGASHYFVDDRTQVTVIEDRININKLTKTEMKNFIKQLLEDKVSTTVLREDKPQKNADHPTMKPLKLLARQIKNSSKRKEIVLDLFGGSGSTLLSCEQLDRTCYMMEYEPRYCDVIIKRWEEYTGMKAEKIV